MKKKEFCWEESFSSHYVFGGDRLFRQENEYKFHRDRDQGSSKERR